MRHWIVLLVTGLVCTALQCGAARADTLNLIFENDLFYHTDRDYTNGAEINWSPSAAAPGEFPASLADYLPLFPDRGEVRVGFSLGQLMFTPVHTRLIVPPPTERPYAGFLYGGFEVTRSDGNRQDEWRMQLGMVGPASLAADSQKFVHSIRNLDMPLGWHTQLRDEPGLIIGYERSHSFVPFPDSFGNHLDFNPHWGATIGNIYDYAEVGAIVRLGFNMPRGGGPPVIQPSPPGSNHYDPQQGFGAYLFTGVEGRIVGRNLFLDGNSFHASPSVDKNALVGDFMFGVAVSFSSFQLSFVHMFRTAEYAGQRNFDQFGRASLAIAF